jgi:hypothetical protein
MTMQRKLHNKMTFGPEAQNEDMHTGKGYGMLGMSGSGFLRVGKQEKGILKSKVAAQS